MKKELFSRKSQVTIFVIIAIVIVAAIVFFLLFQRGTFNSIPATMAPVYDYYISCIDQLAMDGANVMGSQAGWIYSPEFTPGSEYAPFSSHLAVMGLGVPYWYYISANGVKKENIPSKSQMNDQLEKYIEEEINNKCDFSSFINQGYSVEIENISSFKVDIQNDRILVSSNQKLIITKGDIVYSISSHKTEVNSRIGGLYELAKKIYGYEQKTLFLENYTRDVLYTYAPVSGVVLNCSPVVWDPYQVVDRLKNALFANIGMLKVNGDYYSSNGKTSDYFVIGKNNEFNLKKERVNFIYSQNWPARFEIWPTKNNLMVANPIGTQPGLSAMKFCYAPYKFVYDMYFPVLIQVYDESIREVFQFPMAVVINKNVPREALSADYIDQPESICDNANVDITVNTYDLDLNPVEADIEFRCLTSKCGLGRTKIINSSTSASLIVKVPQCVNGVLVANANGYAESKNIISTNEETYVDIIFDKEYKIPLEIYVDNVLSNENAIVLINKRTNNVSNFVDSLSYPFTREIKLSEGDYDFELEVYRNSDLTIPATTTKQCIKQPQDGILGYFGAEEEKCYDINMPSQKLTNIPSAGGKINQYITPDELEGNKIFRIYSTSVKMPSTIEEASGVYDAVTVKKINIQIV